MSKRWVLDTETKGTGAEMVPLDKAHGGAGERPRAPIVVRNPVAPPPKPAPERRPRRFKVVDVMTRQTLADDVDARGAVAALEGLRSVVDVNIYTREDERGDWVQLSQGDRGRLWDLRGRRIRAR